MLRAHFALGAWLLLSGSLIVAQDVGSWRNSPPNSNAIVYDEKGRRLYWDDNGQVVGRYSFRTRRYTSVSGTGAGATHGATGGEAQTSTTPADVAPRSSAYRTIVSSRRGGRSKVITNVRRRPRTLRTDAARRSRPSVARPSAPAGAVLGGPMKMP